MTRRYPLLLDLQGRPVLVVGGGEVATRRVKALLDAGAKVTVIATRPSPRVRGWAGEGQLRLVQRVVAAADVAGGPLGILPLGILPLGNEASGDNASEIGALADGASGDGASGDVASGDGVSGDGASGDVAPRDVAGRRVAPSVEGTAAEGRQSRWVLVHTATGDHDADSEVAQAADAAGIWCVRADDASRSAAHVPAVAQGPDGIQVSVSGGGDPRRALAIRDAIGKLLAVGALPIRRSRARPGTQVQDPWQAPAPGPGTGRVVLVGGGPGNPGLLTLRGRQWLARADVVVTDRLGPRSVLDELDADVEIIDVGKTAGNHPTPQDRINDLLVAHARAGRTVVRLKGGDPFVLGRGGEEALHCLANDVPVEIVPGVTSAISVPALAGIPVTHRGITTSVVIASAHAGAGSAVRASDAAPDDATIVLLMGLSGLAETAVGIIASGRPAATPVAVISRGSTSEERTVTGTLADIADTVAQARLPGPAIVVVGQTVALRERLRPPA